MDAFTAMFPELFPIEEGLEDALVGSLSDTSAASASATHTSPASTDTFDDADILAILADAEHWRGGNTTAHGWCVVA
uniref:Mating-type pheromone BBP1(1) n=1 Tax=Schizophyllum commune TaxID=5334 RepID=BB11_SCHCO|nr:RecName: Full=Mating-type pheromone BBP1(1); Flags: Precursor [Schizophyllum commune]AAB41859.1 pheromone precursor Bbp1(1) [Schizophyllum commune]